MRIPQCITSGFIWCELSCRTESAPYNGRSAPRKRSGFRLPDAGRYTTQRHRCYRSLKNQPSFGRTHRKSALQVACTTLLTRWAIKAILTGRFPARGKTATKGWTCRMQGFSEMYKSVSLSVCRSQYLMIRAPITQRRFNSGTPRAVEVTRPDGSTSQTVFNQEQTTYIIHVQ